MSIQSANKYTIIGDGSARRHESVRGRGFETRRQHMAAEKGDRTLATPGLLVHSSFVIYKLAAAIIIAANNRALRTYSRREV